jgi:hypothetical protein
VVQSTVDWSEVEQSDDKAPAGGPSNDPEWWLEEIDKTQPEVAGTAGDARTIEGAESKLYDSGALCHMSLYCHKFVTYRDIEPRAIATADK